MNYDKLPKDEPIKYVKLANPRLEQHENLSNGMPNYNIKYNIMAKVNNIADKTIYDAIIKYATEQRITDLFLIDEGFVKSALINELSRMAYENAEKEAKEMGCVRIKLNSPKPKRTNFDRITSSVEAMAKFLNEFYSDARGDGFNKEYLYYMTDKKRIEWLQKEVQDEL